MRHSRLPALALLACAAAACGPAKPNTYGDYASLRPVVTLRPKEKPLSHFTVSLAEPASIALFYVVPGVGARLVFPTDSTTSNVVAAGTHELTGQFPRAINRDSVFAARARSARQRPNGGRRDTAGTRTDTRIGGDSAGTIGMTTFSDLGYLLLVTSPSPLTYQALHRHVEGLSIPAEDDPALNTVVKLVRATLPEGAKWAAYATEVELP